jgi:hypothetical protein
VLGWHVRGLADHEPKLRQHVCRFRRLKAFWRGRDILERGLGRGAGPDES